MERPFHDRASGYLGNGCPSREGGNGGQRVREGYGTVSCGSFRGKEVVVWCPSGLLGVFMVNEKQNEKDELNFEQNTTNCGTEEQEKFLF